MRRQIDERGSLRIWIWLMLLLGACFGGDFAQGLPCHSSADCGPRVDCIEGLCGDRGDLDLCGNGLLDETEECDDGNVDEDDACTPMCRLPRCGDGFIAPQEECDDGNEVQGDYCSAECRLPECGDGVIAGDEVCDDGNDIDTDDCTTQCQTSPHPPTLELSFAQVNQFVFSWRPVLGAEYYELWERADVGEEFVRVGEGLVGEEFSLRVPLRHRVNASYRLQAHNTRRHAESTEVAVTGTLTEAVGYFKASNTDSGDQFGYSVALSFDGNTLAVAATHEDSGAMGIDGDQSDGSTNSGAVYVFVREGKLWSQQAYIKASNTGGGDEFGNIVALSSDGNTLAVGARAEDSGTTGIGDADDDSASGAGAVYVFVREDGQWSQQAYVKASNTGSGDSFGTGVALSAEGDTLAVGAPLENSPATGINGDQGNGAGNSGAAYVFVRDGEQWSQQAYIKASNASNNDWFGTGVALSEDGDTLAVAANSEDAGATGIDGDNRGDAKDSGAVYVFVRDGEQWSQQAYVKASNTDQGDRFGRSIALSADGNTLVVGAQEDSSAMGIGGEQEDDSAPNAGAVYVFVREGLDEWSQQAYVKASNTEAADFFGWRVALSSDGNTLAVGAYGEDGSATGIGGDEDHDLSEDAGAAYVFVRDGEQWSQQAYVKASHTDGHSDFGYSLALSGDADTLAVGASLEDSDGTGIGSEPTGDAFDSGAVYVY